MFVLVGPRVGLIVGLYEFGIGLLVCVGFNYKWLHFKKKITSGWWFGLVQEGMGRSESYYIKQVVWA